MVQPIAQRYIGSPIKRSEDTRILTGQGSYVDDIILPGMLYAAFVRSPVAHARITSVEARRRPARPPVACSRGRDRRGARGQDRFPGPDRDRRHDGRIPSPVHDPLHGQGPVGRRSHRDGHRREPVRGRGRVRAGRGGLRRVARGGFGGGRHRPGQSPYLREPRLQRAGRNAPGHLRRRRRGLRRADRVVSAHLRQHRHQNTIPMEGRGLWYDQLRRRRR